MLKKENFMFPLNLQFFAEDGENSNNQNNSNDNGNEENQNNGSESNKNEDQSNNTGEKTFTQSQVNSMMAKEKHEGKNSILKSLGFKTEAEAKKAVNLFNAFMNSQKSEEEKNADEVKKANEEKDEVLQRAEAAENKLLCFELGVEKNSIDDVMAIAKTKLVDGKSLEDVLKEMKKDNKYSVFFEGTNSNNNGTGSQPGHSGGNGSSEKPGDYGKRLAERTSGGAKKEFKSNFF